MIAEARGISSVPDEVTSAEAAPLLCAGITTYNALRNAGLHGGDLVAVQGIGGLGHLGVQFARHMGFRTVAIGRGRDKEKLAKELGAHVYIDSASEDAAVALQRMGGGRAILATGTSGSAMGSLVSGLAAPRQVHRGRGAAGPDTTECVSTGVWRALDLWELDGHAD
jgi:D-arabinose 1-dehydrogenase-like Zn-dependent alcohol dehydrogenase